MKDSRCFLRVFSADFELMQSTETLLRKTVRAAFSSSSSVFPPVVARDSCFGI